MFTISKQLCLVKLIEMIRCYEINPLENSSIHLDLTLIQSGILSRLLNLYFLYDEPFSFGQALSQISVDENFSATVELEKILNWYFEEVEKGLYRPSGRLGISTKETYLSKENNNVSQ